LDIRTVRNVHLRIRLLVGQVVAELAIVDDIIGKTSCRTPVIEIIRAGIEKVDFHGALDATTGDSAWGGDIRRALRVSENTGRDCIAQVICDQPWLAD
jgi:hypothetical protein